MTPERAGLFRRTLAQRTHYMTVLAENTFHPQNAAALIRHCEAFGVQRMHTVESFCEFRPAAAVVRGTDRWVDVCRHASSAEAPARSRPRATASWPPRPIVKTRPPRRSTLRAGLRAGLRHRARRDFRRGDRRGRRISAHPHVRHGREPNVSASAAILIYQLSQRCGGRSGRGHDPAAADRNALPLDAAQRCRCRPDSRTAVRRRAGGMGFRKRRVPWSNRKVPCL